MNLKCLKLLGEEKNLNERAAKFWSNPRITAVRPDSGTADEAGIRKSLHEQAFLQRLDFNFKWWLKAREHLEGKKTTRSPFVSTS